MTTRSAYLIFTVGTLAGMLAAIYADLTDQNEIYNWLAWFWFPAATGMLLTHRRLMRERREARRDQKQKENDQ